MLPPEPRRPLRDVLARYTRSATNPAVFDPATAQILLEGWRAAGLNIRIEMRENFTQIFAAGQLTARHAYMLASNSFEASFLEDAAKRRHTDRLSAFFEAF